MKMNRRDVTGSAVSWKLRVNKTIRRDLLGPEPKDITEDYMHSTIEERRRAVQLLCHTPEN